MNIADVDHSYPRGWPAVLLHHHLLQHASARGERPAVIGGGECWSYEKLDQTSRAYAVELLAAGLQAGDAVTVCSRPSPQAVALLCALSMTGLVYVPVNPDHPAERIADIHRITKARLHVMGRGAEARAAELPEPRAWFEDEALRAPSVGPPTTAAPTVIESDPAYMIFTSGTTGRPKGIVMSHRAIVVGMRALVHHCALDVDDRVGSLAPLSFDFSLSDIGLALGSGAALVCVPPMLVHHPARFLAHLDEAGVTIMCSVPWVWHTVLQRAAPAFAAMQSLRAIFVAGDAFPVSDVQGLRSLRPGLRIVNGFGHSESMCCSFTDVPLPLPADARDIPIGRGHPGAELLVLDSDGRLVETPDAVGELYVRGANLFDGYWNDPDLTPRVLVPDPFKRLRGRIFKSGDHVYRDVDGVLYFAGRRDNQVQVPGMRVELEEVERQLLRHVGIAHACVVEVPMRGSVALVAAVVARPGKALPAAGELRAFCASFLPPYMLPTEVVQVDALPVTAHAKVDRRAVRDQLAATYAAKSARSSPTTVTSTLPASSSGGT